MTKIAIGKSKSTHDLLYSSRKHAAVRTEEYLYNQLIPYIGNKRKLLGPIAEAIHKTGVSSGTFVDFFAGSSVVARSAKLQGFRVIANDWEPYAKIINHCYVKCNSVPAFAKLGGVKHVYETLNRATPIEGYITTHLCPKDDENPDPERERMFYTRANGMKIDAMREQIYQWQGNKLLSEDEQEILLASMMYAISYVSNTSGVFKGFHRGWGGQTKTALYRILSKIELRPPVLFDNKQPNESHQMDAQGLASHLRDTNKAIEIAYLDPPYNQHPYGSNYHVLNTVALWDKPEISPQISGRNKSAIRIDWRTLRRSAYNYASASRAYEKLLHTIDAKFILTSYSTDGNISLRRMLEAAAGRGGISCVKKAYKRYRVSSQRMSQKPMNVEFVLIIDTSRRSIVSDVDRLYYDIVDTEKNALDSHKETLSVEQHTLF